MFKQRNKPPVGPAKADDQGGQQLTRPKRPDVNGTIDALNEVEPPNSEDPTALFDELMSDCGCFKK